MKATNLMLLFWLQSQSQNWKIILVLRPLLIIFIGKFFPTRNAVSFERQFSSPFYAIVWTNQNLQIYSKLQFEILISALSFFKQIIEIFL